MKLKVLAYKYDIFYEDNLTALSGDAVAEHQPFTGVIKVDSLCKQNRPENDIMHEVFESAKWQLETPWEHKDLTAISNLICQVLRDNPQFTYMFLLE
jgi:hypothetical protein